MSLRENLRKKIRIERLSQKIAATMKEVSGHHSVDKEAVGELLQLTDFEPVKTRDLLLYVRPYRGDLKEVLVFDNELPIYHSTVADVAMRKTPHWKEMFNIKNIIKVLDDKDVVVGKGRESLNRISAVALAQLDFSFTKEDLDRMLRDAQRSLQKKSAVDILESLALFSELLGFEPIVTALEEPSLQLFGKLKIADEKAPLYEDLVVYNQHRQDVLLLKGDFSPRSDWDLARLLRCVHQEIPPDAEGEDVFAYLVTLARQRQNQAG